MSMIYRQQIYLLHVRVKDNRYNYNDPLGNNGMNVVCIDTYFVPILRFYWVVKFSRTIE